MSFKKHLSQIIALAASLVLLCGSLAAQTPSLIISVDSVVVPAGTTSGYVIVNLENTTDTIVAFELWLQLSNPEIIQFTPVVDTSGTLISGWGNSAISLSGIYYDIDIIATTGPAPFPLAIAPQPGGTLLKLPVIVQNIPDTATLRSVDILVQHVMPDHFNFSDIYGNSIGWVTDTILDTTYYTCTAWASEVCLNWMQVPAGQPFDSINIQWQLYGHIDTNLVQVNNGNFLIAEPLLCGDMDDSGNNDVSDLTYFIAYLFGGGPEPVNLQTADCTGDRIIDVADLTCYVCYLFLGCPPPVCF